MTDPYRAGLFSENPYAAKRDVLGRLVVILRGKLENRALELIVPISRAVKKNEIHEIIITDQIEAAPGKVVNSISYVGFLEVASGGVLVAGDEVISSGRVLGKIAGFDETHLPNHLNIVLLSSTRPDGVELGLKLESEIIIKHMDGDD